MKKLSLLVLLLIAGVSCTFAQFAPVQKRAHVGFTTDLNVSTINADGFTSKPGFALGFKGDVLFSDYVYMNYGLQWSMKGWKLEDITATAHYMNLPIHVGGRYAFGYDRVAAVFVDFGPFIAVGLGGKESASGYHNDYFGNTKKGYANVFDAGLGFTVGFQYRFIDIHLGYDFGLVEVYKASDSPKTRNFYVGLGFMF